MKTIVAFDDTGSPGVETGAKMLNKERKTYVGAIILSDQLDALTSVMSNGVELIRAELGISEFHLTDIMNGKGEWENIPSEQRIQTFEGMCDVFSQFYIPCVVQTWSSQHYIDNNFNVNNIESFEHLDNKNYDHFAFYLCLMKAVRYICEFETKLPASFFCDEGIRKQGSFLEFSFLKNLTSSSKVMFEESKSNIYLQLADFAAYCFNKQQMIVVKENKTETDIRILTSISNAGFDYVDMETISGDPKTMDADLYDYKLLLKHMSVHN
ncbi:DUF3800 domain-containing protein [Vibrio harveyi]|uniref:DUF3800 domain-containing protein n=1 Tax=Vibrio harveyi TaxID=669 RepID=UPI00237E0ADF|nr:DUF3800 domain-containing protein [Vibrio harveyi]HDM8056342.1 DUF3800 domain-containing protein [Vibrio harveyi]